MGGVILNYGTDIGVLGERTHKGPARAMGTLGLPTAGGVAQHAPQTVEDKLKAIALKSVGIPNIPGLGGSKEIWYINPSLHHPRAENSSTPALRGGNPYSIQTPGVESPTTQG